MGKPTRQSTIARLFHPLAWRPYILGFLQERLTRHWLYKQRQEAFKQLFELDAETLAKAGLTYEEIRWEARLPLKNDTAEKLETWRKLGLIS